MAAQKIGGRFIHLPDIHMNTDLLDAVADLMDTRTAANNNIHYDAIFSPGDFIEGWKVTPNSFGSEESLNKYAEKITKKRNQLFKITQEKGIKTQEDLQTALEHSDQDAINFLGYHQSHFLQRRWDTQAMKEVVAEQNITLDDLVNGVRADYEAIKPSLTKLAEKAPFLAVMGNHDTKQGYEVLDKKHGGPIHFVEYDNRAGVTIKCKNGLEWFVQGDTNTYEVPFLQSVMQELATKEGKDTNNIFINYDSGRSIKEENKGIQSDSNYTTGMQNPRAVNSYAMFQRMRLDDTVKDAQGNSAPDLYLTHKTTKGGVWGTGDIAAKSKGVFAGHDHFGQVGNLYGPDLRQAIKDSTETTTVEGFDEEVKVVYFDDSEVPQINGGDKLFFEVIYDDNKKIEKIIAYELYQEAA